MEVVLLLEITSENNAVIYSSETKEETTVKITNDQSKNYQQMLEDTEESVLLVFDKDNLQLISIENEMELR